MRASCQAEWSQHQRVSRKFHKHAGLSFVQYINRLRIELACKLLLREEMSVTKICYEIGFNNVSNFNRQFFLLKNMSPSKFRSLHSAKTAFQATVA